MNCLKRADLKLLKAILTEVSENKSHKLYTTENPNFDYKRELQSIDRLLNLIKDIDKALDRPKAESPDKSLFWKLDFDTCKQLKIYTRALKESYTFKLDNGRYDTQKQADEMRGMIHKINSISQELDHAIASHKHRLRKENE